MHLIFRHVRRTSFETFPIKHIWKLTPRSEVYYFNSLYRRLNSNLDMGSEFKPRIYTKEET